jgi:ABC-type nitrate/sulfonate/bicarbonate transport system substrate-binding protein
MHPFHAEDWRSAVNLRAALRALAAASVVITAAGPAAGEEISIGLASTSFANAAPRVAKELGLFEKRGLDAKFTVMDNANAATTALISKSTDFALSGAAELIAANARGQPVVAVANTYGGFSGTLVLAKSVADKLGVAPDAPVTARLKALDGLVLASPSATGAYTLTIRAAAAAAGANVRLVYMALPAMQAAMDSGAVQGYMTGAPFWSVPVLKGSGVAWLSGPKGEFPAEFIPAITSNIQTLKSNAQAKPGQMKRLAEVFADLGRAIDERPADVKAAVGRLYPTLDAATLDLLFEAEARSWKPRPLSAKDMAHEISYIKRGGIPIPNVDTIDPATMLWP